MKFDITQYIGEFITGIMAIAGTWFAKGKIVKAETKSAEANALEAMQKAYDMYVEHNNAKMLLMEKEIQEFRTELERVEKYWKNKYNALLREFKEYKKSNPK